jgi:hypothetical protein
VRWVFLRGLGLIYLATFLSLWVQIRGLVGSNGILPAALRMEALGSQAAEAHLGWARFHLVPTFCWLDSSDGFLVAQCAAGTVLSALLVLNLAPALCLAILWALYLSLTTIGGEFLSFQWDNLLLETGVLALFFAPLQWRPGAARAPPPSRLVLWLLRWLLFRLMFASGCVKLLSKEPTWRDLTALKFHYETQPLPTWVGWYAAQLPARTQQVCTGLMFVIELAVPFLVFGPRRLRQVACVLFIALQEGVLKFVLRNLENGAFFEFLKNRFIPILTIVGSGPSRAAAMLVWVDVTTHGRAATPRCQQAGSLPMLGGDYSKTFGSGLIGFSHTIELVQSTDALSAVKLGRHATPKESGRIEFRGSPERS